MKFKIPIVAFLGCLMAINCSYADSAKEEIIVIKDKPQPADPKSKPRAPAKRNVEAWLEGSVMTIIFTTSEGDATLSLET